MGIFNFFNKNSKIKPILVENELGNFTLKMFGDSKNMVCIIDSPINKKIELVFPVFKDVITAYQVDYFKKIESNWKLILDRIKNKLPETPRNTFKVLSVMIPDKENPEYETHAEIVLELNNSVYSVILKDLQVDAIITIE